MKKMAKCGNDGFSLVELIVVVAIIAVLGLVAAMGMSLVASRPADECAKKIQIALEGNRNTTMGKYSSSITFSADSDGVYMEEIINGVSEGKVKIGQSGVTVQYCTQKVGEVAATIYNLSSAPVTLSFDRADGSLTDQGDGSTYVKYFAITRGERNFKVTIDRLTGRVAIE